MIVAYLKSWLPWRWLALLVLMVLSAPLAFSLFGWGGVLFFAIFYILIDLIVGIGRRNAWIKSGPTERERYNELLREHLELRLDFQNLNDAVSEYMKYKSADGAPVRMNLRKKLEKLINR